MTFRKMALANAAALAAVTLFAACSGGGSDGGTPTTPGTPSNEVHLAAASFAPGSISVSRGTTVKWINDTSNSHTITPDNAGQTGVWTSQSISGSGTSFQFTFTNPGTYTYHCAIHAGMTGTVTVN